MFTNLPPTPPPKPHLPGPAATRKWWEAVQRGDVGVLEREVSRIRDKHARMLLQLNHPSSFKTNDAINTFPTNITLQQAISDLINMQQPWTKVSIDNDDPYLDEYDGGSSALSLATGKGHTEVISYLLSLGCVDLSLTDAQGMHAMHHACVQGNADILKILLLACPNRAIQFSLLKSRDKRAMDCRKLVSVGRDEWQSAGVTAHSSGSFMRRKKHITKLLNLPFNIGKKWWINKTDRRKKRRRLGQGKHGDNAGSRNFDLTQSLVSSPPAPNVIKKYSSHINKNAMQHLILASRRTRSPLSTLTNEHIWLTALEYDEDEELELGSAIAHSPKLKQSMESIHTVQKAKQSLIVLRFVLNMRKVRNESVLNVTTVSLLLKKRDGAMDKNGLRMSWHNVDEKSREKKEMEWMEREDKRCTQLRSYLTVETIKMNQLLLLYNKLSGCKTNSISTMSSMKFSRFASLVGQFSNEEHVATILTSLPNTMRNEEYFGDCSRINFVQFWLNAEKLERKQERKKETMNSNNVIETVDEMVNQLNTHITEDDQIKIDWFTRLRTRMRINSALAMPQNGDPKECRYRSKLMMQITMGVGIVPLYHPTLVSHRKTRSALVRFQPAKEFTAAEATKQRRSRHAKVGNTEQPNDAKDSKNTKDDDDDKEAVPELPAHLQRENTSGPKSFQEEENGDLNEEEKKAKALLNQKSKAEKAASKRMMDAKRAAKKSAEREAVMKKKREEKKIKDIEDAKLQAEAFEMAQKIERTRLKKLEKKKKREEKKKKRDAKDLIKKQKKETQKRNQTMKKNRSKVKKVSKTGRRRVDDGTGGSAGKDKSLKTKLKTETPEERNHALEKLNRRGKKARDQGHKSAVDIHKLKEKSRFGWNILKNAVKVKSVVKDIVLSVKTRNAVEIVNRKDEMKRLRKQARKRAMYSLEGDEEWNIHGGNSSDEDDDNNDGAGTKGSGTSSSHGTKTLKAPQDEGSVLARKLMRQKKFIPNEVLGKDHEEEGWCVADGFINSGYAHKKGLHLIKLKPIRVGVYNKKTKSFN